MKKIEICFEHVRDCPQWASGECLHWQGTGKCLESEIALPPKHCPIADDPTPDSVGVKSAISVREELDKIKVALDQIAISLAVINLEMPSS